jgi:hypothetical protein
MSRHGVDFFSNVTQVTPRGAETDKSDIFVDIHAELGQIGHWQHQSLQHT